MINRIIALLYFFLIFPLLLLIFLLIFFIDRSNPVFNQIRVGRNEVPFKIYKFRTMINSNEKDYFKKNYKEISRKQKTRETKIGQILRKLSLDELPQLINVINGSMNFVGQIGRAHV
jgi:lipopolysaccharide/colanic/teichoic acid biosynthesis glycosyltransferase